MTQVETATTTPEFSESVSGLAPLVKLLAEALSLSGSTSELVREIQQANLSVIPAKAAEYVAQLQPVVDELRVAREARRQRAFAAVSAARKDQATGLPGVTSAQAEIEKALASEHPATVSLLVFEQLRPLNLRFGRAVGDEVLASTAADLALLLADFGELFRWNGPSFVLVSPPGRIKGSNLEDRLHEIASSRIERTFEVENRAIHLKITFFWHTQQLAPSDVIHVSRALDDLVASRLTTADHRT